MGCVKTSKPATTTLPSVGHVARDHAHRAGLARAVGTEEAEDLALLDAEADVIDSRDRPVAFREVLDLNHEDSFIA